MAVGIEDCFVIKQNKRLQCGYTTGSCAAGASRAAAEMLLTGRRVNYAEILTPKGIRLNLEILEQKWEEGGKAVSCAVRKFSGDDPDVTDGILVYARAEKRPEPGILIDGGIGVGRVTRPGLSQPVGEAAINRVPREMITQAVEDVCRAMDYDGGISVVISIPDGVELAKKTFNPRLGIEGGISVLGTSGIVVPMSEEALIASIRLELEMRKAQGLQYLLITPGNYGADYTKAHLEVPDQVQVKCSNFVGETLDIAADLGFAGIVFVAHVGKFVKVAGGIMNTHSRNADSRAELMAAFALRAGGSRELAVRILDSITTEEALELMDTEGIKEKAMALAADRAKYYLQHRIDGRMKTEVVLFSSAQGFLAQTEGAEELLLATAAQPAADFGKK